MYDSPLPNQEGDDGGNVIPIDEADDLEGDPWVITFDNLLSDEEFDDLIQLGNKEGYERSKDIGKTLDQKQQMNPSLPLKVQDVHQQLHGVIPNPNAVSNLLRNVSWMDCPQHSIYPKNMEDFQMLKYEVGEFYRHTHHDYIGHQKDRNCGPRILTICLYLFFSKAPFKVQWMK